MLFYFTYLVLRFIAAASVMKADASFDSSLVHSGSSKRGRGESTAAHYEALDTIAADVAISNHDSGLLRKRPRIAPAGTELHPPHQPASASASMASTSAAPHRDAPVSANAALGAGTSMQSNSINVACEQQLRCKFPLCFCIVFHHVFTTILSLVIQQ